jgi:hypothetical protein
MIGGHCNFRLTCVLSTQQFSADALDSTRCATKIILASSATANRTEWQSNECSATLYSEYALAISWTLFLFIHFVDPFKEGGGRVQVLAKSM